MIYDLTKPLDKQKYKARANHLYAKGKIVELKELSKRSLSQNSYLHVLLSILAIDRGESREYVKKYYYKRLVNRDIFVITRKDAFLGEIEDLRSSTELTKEEMSLSIERLRNWASSELGCYLPSADEKSLLEEAELEIQRYKDFI